MKTHIHKSGFATTGGCLLCYAVALCVGAANSVTAQDTPPKDLGMFYQMNCARCHGADGAGRSADGKKLRGADFTNARWRAKTSDAEMVKVILKGIFFGLGMPSFKNALTAEDAGRMVTDIIRGSEKGKVIGTATPSADVVRDGP